MTESRLNYDIRKEVTLQAFALERNTSRPESTLTKIVDKIVTFLAGTIMYTVWSTLGLLVWLYALMRAMLAWIIRKILAFGHGDDGPAREQLDAITHIWPDGYTRIRASLSGKVSDVPYAPPPLPQALRETFLAILFYGGVAGMIYVSTLWSYSGLYTWLISPAATATVPKPALTTPQTRTFDDIFKNGKK